MTPEDLVALARDLKTKRNRAASSIELDLYRRDMADLVPELADALEAALKENERLRGELYPPVIQGPIRPEPGVFMSFVEPDES